MTPAGGTTAGLTGQCSSGPATIPVVTDPQDWRSRKRDQTHARIIAVALRLFGEHGYDQVSVAQIAAEAGISVPTFYAHFPAKEHVVMHVPSVATLTELVARQPADLPMSERMRGIARDWVAGFGPEERAQMLARWQIVVSDPGLRLRSAEVERTTARMIVEQLESSGRADPSAAVVVNAYLSVMNTALLTWGESGGRRTLEEIAEQAFDALRRHG